MALVIVDIDRFKRVNDTYGHIVGDEVIKVVAGLVDQALADLGRVGRLGGEEFALLSRDAEPGLMMLRLEALRHLVSMTSVVVGSTSVSVTISAGWAVRQPGQALTELYSEADRALYLAKATGRNVVIGADQVSRGTNEARSQLAIAP
ncbi:GGDEF domain-containing protein [Micromonospora sp. STR1s_5]|nr:GGDEF domain-containing protein [Micromonospora sp. STR1s_5]